MKRRAIPLVVLLAALLALVSLTVFADTATTVPEYIVQDGLTYYVRDDEAHLAADCNVCGDEREVGDHVWAPWETVKEPTSSEDGEKQSYCTECGEVKTESIPKLPSEPADDPEEDEEPDVDDGSGIEDCTGDDEPQSFFDMIISFFASIFSFILRLFGLNNP